MDSLEWTHDTNTLTIEMFFPEAMQIAPAITNVGFRLFVDGASEPVDTPLTTDGSSVVLTSSSVDLPLSNVTLLYDGTNTTFNSLTGKPVWVFNELDVQEGG